MSRPILELCRCQVSSIKICCDRLYNGGGVGGGGGEGWRDLGREDRVAQADRPADIHIALFCLPQMIRLQLSVTSFLCRDPTLILTLIQPRQQL